MPIADCRLPIADCRLPIADCRLPIADCRLPIADCRLPIADCRFYGNGVCGQVGLVGLCHVFSSCIMPMTSATDKSHYFILSFPHHHSRLYPVIPALFHHSRPHLRHSRPFPVIPAQAGINNLLVIPAPAYAGTGYGGNQLAAGRRMLMAQSAI